MYIPLHQKYRPQTFDQLVGQDVIRTTLSQGVRLGRIAPAYMFTGPRGTGKTSSARILAKALNCQSTDQPTPEPCGECALCRAIAQGNALDIIEIDAASHTGVDNVREMIERAQFAPVQARYKVFIIDECHMLSGAAFNALLKTLEEPPERVVFVLATTDPQRVPATIVSRCQRFDFRRIAQADMEAHLRRIADQEGIAITPAALTLVAQLAQGGLRDAESLLDQLSLLPPPVQPEQVWELAGRVPERDLWELVQSIYGEPLLTVLQRGRALLERGWEPLHLYQQLVGFVRDGLIALTAPQERHLTTLMPDTWQAWQTLGERVTVTDLLQAQEYLRQNEPQLRHSTQPHLWLEVILLGWWHLWQEKTATAGPAPPPSPTQTPAPHRERKTPAPRTTAPAPTPSTPTAANPSPAPAINSSSQTIFSSSGVARASSTQAIPSPAKVSSSSPQVIPSAEVASSSPAPTINSSGAAIASSEVAHASPAQTIPSSETISSSSPPATPSSLSAQAAASSAMPSAGAATATSPPATTPAAAGQDFAALWAQVVKQIKKPPARALFQDASLVKLENHQAEVVLKSSALLRNAQGKIKELQAAFQQVLQQPVTVHLRAAQKGETLTPAPPVASPTNTQASPPTRLPSPDISKEDQVMLAAQRLAHFFQGEVMVPPEEPEEF